MAEIKVFGLLNSKKIAKEIADQLGIEVGKLSTEKFSDTEMTVFYEETIRKREIYLVASTNSPEAIIELVLAIDAAKRAGVKSVNVIMTYYGYARQDRRDHHRGSISAKALATVIESVGMDSMITIDLHANQIEGFFSKPVIHLQGSLIFIPYLKNIVNSEEYAICSPDQGGSKRATEFSDKLHLPFVMMNKRRDGPGVVKSMDLVGDVKGKKVIIIDDLIDSGGSLSKAVDVLIANGAVEVSACITHPVLSGKAFENINSSKLMKLYVADTISVENRIISDKIEVVPCSQVLGKIIARINKKQSIVSLSESLTI